MTARSLILTWLFLMVLAAVSWLAATADLGIGLALAIGALKTIAIALIFMELLHGHPTDRMIGLAALFFVLLMTFGVLADVSLR
jgi:hypothetical protein